MILMLLFFSLTSSATEYTILRESAVVEYQAESSDYVKTFGNSIVEIRNFRNVYLREHYESLIGGIESELEKSNRISIFEFGCGRSPH